MLAEVSKGFFFRTLFFLLEMSKTSSMKPRCERTEAKLQKAKKEAKR